MQSVRRVWGRAGAIPPGIPPYSAKGAVAGVSATGSEAGFTLVSTMVDAVLVAVSALALFALLAYNGITEMKLKRWAQGDQALVNSTAALQDMSFSALHDFCSAKGALNAARPPVCSTPEGMLASGPAVQPGTDPLTGNPKVVDVLRDWSGDGAPAGRACVELVSCMEQAGGQMLAVTVRSVWVDPSKPGQGLIKVPKALTFRMTR